MGEPAAQAWAPHGGSYAVPQQLLQSMQSRLATAQQQHAALANAILSGAPNGASSAGGSHNVGMAAMAQNWGDPNARLDAMLSEAVTSVKHAPTLRRRPKQPNGGIGGGENTLSAAPPQIPATTNDTGTSGDSSWELVGAGADGGPASAAAHLSEHPSQSLPQQEVVAEDDYYEYYIQDDGPEEGEEGAYGEEVVEGDPAALEQVLRLQSQLHDLDMENTSLRQQLEQQRKLMAMMQASLLAQPTPDTPTPGDAAASTAPPPTSTPAADQPHDAVDTAVMAAGRPAGLPPRPPTLDVSNPTHSPSPTAAAAAATGAGGATLDAGFDALAATPRTTLPSPTASAGGTTPQRMSRDGYPAGSPALPTPAPPAAAAALPGGPGARPTSFSGPLTGYAPPAVPPGAQASSRSGPLMPPPAAATPSTPYALSPDVDILEGLGLAGPADRTSARSEPASTPAGAPPSTAGSTGPQPGTGAGTHAAGTGGKPTQQPPPIERKPSDGELEALRAVEEYERQQQAAHRAPAPAQPRGPSTVAPPPAFPPHPAYSGASYPPAPAHPPPAYPPAAPHGYPPMHAPAPYPSMGAAPWASGLSASYPAPPPAYHHHLSAHYGAGAPPAAGSPWGSWSHPQPPAPTGTHYPAVRPAAASGWAPAAAAAGAGAPSTPSTPPAPWTCQACTYAHEGKEAGFLRCAMCNAQK